MVRVVLILVALVWSLPARASIIPTGQNINISGPAVSTLSGKSATNPAINGDRISISICIATTTATFTTPTGFSTDGATFTGAHGQCAHFSKNASGEPANFNGYSVSWTTAASAGIQIWVYHGTQGPNTISYDSQGHLDTTATSPALPFPTLAQTSELIEFDGLAAGFNANSCDAGPYLFQANSSWGSCIWGESGTSQPANYAITATAGGSAQWTGQTIAWKESTAGAAIYIGAGSPVSGSASTQVLGNTTAYATGDVWVAVLGLNSASPSVTGPTGCGPGWTQQTSISNANANPNAATELIYTHTIAGGDGNVCTFSNSATGNQNLGVILTFGHINTSTPLDVIVTAAFNQINKRPLLALNPTSNDELLLRAPYTVDTSTVSAPPTGLVQPTSLNGGHGSFEVEYSDVSFNGLLYTSNNVNRGMLSIALGVQSATTPSRTTANQRVDQLGLMTLTPFGAPEPPPSCGNCGIGVGAP